MRSTPPRFSVIIPNYNNADTLARAIISVLDQTYPAYEIIIVDDGSVDNSQAIVAGFSGKVHYVFQQNSGVSAARNLGARLATGDWLAFLDADDCYFSARLATHARWIQKEPDIEFLLGDQEFRTPDDRLIRRAMESSLSGRCLLAAYPGQTEIPLYAEDFERLIEDGFGEIRTLSVPREKFLNLGGFAVGMRVGEDLHFIIRLCAASTKAGAVNVPLAIYYIYPDSVMRKNILESQKLFVSALASLAHTQTALPRAVKLGLIAKIRHARLDLAYAYHRQNKRYAAFRSILPNLFSEPGIKPLRDLLSVLR